MSASGLRPSPWRKTMRGYYKVKGKDGVILDTAPERRLRDRRKGKTEGVKARLARVEQELDRVEQRVRDTTRENERLKRELAAATAALSSYTP